MEQTTQELKSHIESQSVPQPPQNLNFHDMAIQQVQQQVPNLDPSQIQLATFLATLQIKTDHESRLARHLLEKSLMHVTRMGKSGRFTRVNPAKDVHFTRANQAKNVHLTRVGKPSKNWPFYPSG